MTKHCIFIFITLLEFPQILYFLQVPHPPHASLHYGNSDQIPGRFDGGYRPICKNRDQLFINHFHSAGYRSIFLIFGMLFKPRSKLSTTGSSFSITSLAPTMYIWDFSFSVRFLKFFKLCKLTFYFIGQFCDLFIFLVFFSFFFPKNPFVRFRIGFCFFCLGRLSGFCFSSIFCFYFISS